MRSTVLAIVSGFCLTSALVAETAEPRVPAGMDPGGVAVALIGGGVDYTAPDIAQRLARDGEGELIGWDFADDDRRPFASGGGSGGTALARVVLGEAPSARLAVFRVAPEPGGTVARATAYASRSPARIVLLPTLGGRSDLEPFGRAAAHFKDRLFIVPAGGASAALPALENVLVVAAAGPAGQPIAGSEVRPTNEADIAVGAGEGNGADIAAARIAALAARLSAQDPKLAGSALKSRITSLAVQPSASGFTRFGSIANPLDIAGE